MLVKKKQKKDNFYSSRYSNGSGGGGSGKLSSFEGPPAKKPRINRIVLYQKYLFTLS